MFGNGPSREEHNALVELVMSHGQLLSAQTEKINADSEVAEIVAGIAKQANAELHLLKGLMGAIVSEIAARSDDPYRELMSILRRLRFATGEFTIDDQEAALMASSACEVICEYAEIYLRRGEGN